jgi:hypothetical protein
MVKGFWTVDTITPHPGKMSPVKTVRSDEGDIVDPGALPEYVYVVDITEPEHYISVHSTYDGAQQHIGQIASDWGVPIEQLVSEVIEKVVESP